MSETLVTIAEFDFNVQSGELRRGTNSHRLSPKAGGVLRCLLRAEGEVVSRETLHEAVWAGQIVTDTQISKAIAELRQAFDDDATNSRYIETLPKRGYRLLVPPSAVEQSGSGSEHAATTQPRRKLYAGVLVALIFIALGALLTTRPWVNQPSPLPQVNTIAVVAFTADTAAASAWAETIRQDISAEISNTRLQVVLPEASPAYLLQGSVRLVGEEVVVRVQMTGHQSGKVYWTKRLSHDAATTPTEFGKAAFVSLMAEAVAGFQFMRSLYPDNQEAVELHIKALTEYHQIILGEGGSYHAAEEFAKQSLAVDPSFDGGHILLASWYALRLGGELLAQDALPLAHKHIAAWLTLQPNETFGLALINRLLDLDYEAALQNLAHAEQHPSPVITQGAIEVQYCHVYLMMGELAQANDACQRALAHGVETDQSFLLTTLAWISRLRGDPERAIAYINQAMDAEATASIGTLIGATVTALAAGETARANRALDQLLAKPQVDAGDFIHLIAMAGRTDLANKLLAEAEEKFAKGRLLHFGPLFTAYRSTGNLDRAFFFLQKAIENREGTFIVEIKNAPYYDNLRQDPRWLQVMATLREIEATGSRTQSIAMGARA